MDHETCWSARGGHRRAAGDRGLFDHECRGHRLNGFLAAFGFDAVHGTTVSYNGDGGHGLDNDNPWYRVYYEVDGTSDLDARVLAVARAAGHTPKRLPNPPDPLDPSRTGRSRVMAASSTP